MARPKSQTQSLKALASRQFRRFPRLINADKVFGKHKALWLTHIVSRCFLVHIGANLSRVRPLEVSVKETWGRFAQLSACRRRRNTERCVIQKMARPLAQ